MNAQQAWQATLGQLQSGMSKAQFDTWVRDAEIISHEEDVFTIGAANAYARDWLENRLGSTVTRTLTGLMNKPQTVKFVVWQKDFEATDREIARPPEDEAPGEPELRVNYSLNSRYTFETFVVGSNNRLAHAASMAVAENPMHAYNPLFIYSDVGLGKTHLLHAIGNYLHKSGLQVLYASSEEFTNDVINSIRTHNMNNFRERYRHTDILLIDDIQFIVGREATQEEFFHTFNTLYGQEKQIVITSDRPPKSMIALEERFRSRFGWGLTVDIQAPDFETRVAILRSKLERAGRSAPNDILELIAQGIKTNIRELEGALTRVLAFADLSNQLLTADLVKTALADLLPQRGDVKPDQVVEAVAAIFGITPERLLTRDRSREVALPRQVAMYLLRQEVGMSLPQIGEAMGGRDHTTVMYACEKVEDLMERDDRVRKNIIVLRDQLFGRGR